MAVVAGGSGSTKVGSGIGSTEKVRVGSLMTALDTEKGRAKKRTAANRVGIEIMLLKTSFEECNGWFDCAFGLFLFIFRE